MISHEHRFVFVELPRTGSTAIRHELRDMYGARPILHKHATYEEFLRRATADEKRYFVFSGIRHPLDDAVSLYFKLRTDHKSRHTDPDRAPKHRRLLNRLRDDAMYRFIQQPDADFATFFLRFYRLPFDTWASLSHRRFDYVIRFERLSEDFEQALRRIGIEPLRPLPVINRTSSRDRDYSTYYTPEAQRRARRVLGPYMERWGYEFPASWELPPPSRFHRLQYQAFSFFARIYWRFLRSVA
jgi:sulfotransferase famil protein